MEQCKIDFNSIPWEIPAYGVRFKAYKQNGKQVRLVEFTDKFVETDWCTKGHIVYSIQVMDCLYRQAKKINILVRL